MSISWNPWHGCCKISEGCRNCYVYRQDSRHDKDSREVRQTAMFDRPIRRSRDGRFKVPAGEMVYTCFTSDFLLEEADDWRAEAWEMMRIRHDLRFMFFTKRIDRLAAALPPDCDWADAQTLGTLLYDKAQPAPELSVFVLDTADHSWAADAASLYEDMKAVEREYDLHCGLQQLFTQADGCAVPAYRADSGYDFALLAADGASVYVSGLQAQLAAALCGQTGRFFTAFAGGQAVCDTRVNVTAEDTTVQLHLRDTDFQPLGAYNEDWQALLCTELQQAFSALTADDAADFFHLQFWHVNLCGPGSAMPVPRLEILFE